MYKKIAISIFSTLLLTGCAKDLNTVDGVVNSTNGVLNTLGKIGNTIGIGTSGGPKSGTVGSYTINNENIQPVVVKKTSRNYGKISVFKYEKNPYNKTQVFLNNCTQLNIGKLNCGGYMYEMTKEGWLVKDHISLNHNNNRNITLASGTYYIKLQNTNAGKKYNVTGSLNIKPHVTNYINLELE